MNILQRCSHLFLESSGPKQISLGCKVWKNPWIPSSMLLFAAAPSSLVPLEPKSPGGLGWKGP